MWYPNKYQWVVIWLTSLLALVIWVFSAHNPEGRIAISILTIGLLLIWQLSRPREQSANGPSLFAHIRQSLRPRWASSPDTEAHVDDPRVSTSWLKRLGLWILSFLFIGISLVVLTNASEYAGYLPEMKIRTFDKGTYGEMAPVLKVIFESWRSIQSDDSKLEKEMETILTTNPLGVDVFKESKNIARAQEEVRRVMALLDGFEGRFNMRIEEIDGDLNNLNIRESLKASLMKGYEQTRDLRLKQAAESFRIQKTILRKVDGCLEFIKQHNGKYKVVGNEILFASKDDLSEYRSFLSEIDALQAQYTSLVNAGEGQDLRRLEKARSKVGQ